MSTPRLQFDALAALDHLRDRYTNFLLDEMSVRDPVLRQHLTQLWTTPTSDGGYPLFAPLHIEPTFPFAPGATADAVGLTEHTCNLLRDAGIDYPLYAHQVEAIQAARRGETVIVSAGTGSGKTEAFLFPILDQLLRDHADGVDDLSQPGVRALVIYPLNALVNNQIARIRNLLGHQELITFAYYTSRLPSHFRDAQRDADLRGVPLAPTCQLFDRRTLRGIERPPDDRPIGPPHILVTNFSMLEYMLVRPDDQPIFTPEHTIRPDGAPRLRAVVLDEAHVYAGAQAAEIHLLLRRAAMKFRTELSDLQGYATSATLSSDGSTTPLTTFATQMFAKRADDVAPIIARRHLPPIGDGCEIGLVSPDEIADSFLVPPQVRTLDYDDAGSPCALREDAEACALASQWLDAFLTRTPTPDGAGRPALLLHRALVEVAPIVALREWLFGLGRTATLDEVTAQLFARNDDRARRAASVVLCLGSLARVAPHEHPLIPTRLHAMVRAPSGAWAASLDDVTAMRPTPRDNDFKAMVCGRCGYLWLTGWRVTDDWGDETVLATFNADAEPFAFSDVDDRREARAVTHHLDRPWRATLDGPCPQCGDTSKGNLRDLSYSPRFALGAILDAVYPFLAEAPAGGDLPGRGRRLMTFSDSRQAAARLAAELEQTHDRGINRQILWRALQRTEQPQRVRDLLRDLAGDDSLRSRALWAERGDHDERDVRDELAALCVYEEFARPPRHGATLETLGLVEVVYPTTFDPPGSFAADMWNDLMAVLLDEARRRGATKAPGRWRVYEGAFPDFINIPLVEVSGEGRSIPWRGEAKSPVNLFVSNVAAQLNVDPVELSRLAWKSLVDAQPRWLSRHKDGFVIDLEQLELRVHASPPAFDLIEQPMFRRFAANDHGVRHAVHPTGEGVRDRWRTSHRVRRVLDDEPLALWSIEHTAQIAAAELEAQERLFVRGERNLLSSSTTMEMGVDVGGLTLVLLTNVPPGPSNYFQRAGRAGRRADGSSLVLTLADNRPHDQKAFADPAAYLASPIVPPEVNLDAKNLAERHVNSLLISLFFEREELTKGGGPMGSFGSVEGFFVGPDAEPTVAQLFVQWLHTHDSITHQPLRRLTAGTPLAAEPVDALLDRCATAIERIASTVLADLSLIQQMLDENDAHAPDEALRASLERQRKRIHRETLIRFLIRQDFLPRFGFPVDVVKLETTTIGYDHFTANDEGAPLRLERDLRIALAEYVPGREVVARKYIHRSAGIIRNWELDVAQARYVLRCVRCDTVVRRDALPSSCDICGHPAALGTGTSGENSPSPVFLYFEPASFAVEFSRRPRRYTAGAELKFMQPPLSRIIAATPQLTIHHGSLQLDWSPHSTHFTVSRGRGNGFVVCQRCGFSAPEEGKDALPRTFATHKTLRGLDTCANQQKFWRRVAFGTTQSVDAVVLHPGTLLSPNGAETLAMCLRFAAANLLQVSSRTLESLACGRPETRAAAVFETSGAGFLGLLLRGDQPDALMHELRRIVHGPEADLLRFDSQHLFKTDFVALDEVRDII